MTTTDTAAHDVEDICERLSEAKYAVLLDEDNGDIGDWDLCDEAASLIRQLRDENGALRRAVDDLCARLSEVARAALSAQDGAVGVKALEWQDHRGQTFPDTWTARTPCGVYEIEERSASDSPAYVVTGPLHVFIADKDSLDEAKAAAQADYEARIRSALTSPSPTQEAGAEPVEAGTTAEEIIKGVRALIVAERKHADRSESHGDSTRDDADYCHADLLRFTVADCDNALRLIKRRRSSPPRGASR